ncbi:hypothetical protein VXQ18_03475, partial [Brucella abortus]|nr:hypothetical protein [Brucella abortus]
PVFLWTAIRKALPLTVSLARRAWGWSKALMSTVLRRQTILSEINGAQPSSFRVRGKFSAIDILINDASFLAKDAATIESDCAFVLLTKAT